MAASLGISAIYSLILLKFNLFAYQLQIAVCILIFEIKGQTKALAVFIGISA